jgi:hypothetical protein
VQYIAGRVVQRSNVPEVSMRRAAALATSCLLVVVAATVAVAAAAQEPLRTVVITVGPRSVGIAGAENLPAGPTRIEIRGTSRRQIEGVLVALRPGQTLESLRRALPRSQRGPAPLKRLITFEAGSAPRPGRPYATTIDLRPGTTYVAAHRRHGGDHGDASCAGGDRRRLRLRLRNA